jgi:hypothetical protein
MRCHQCNRPALYKITDQEIPLCLECFHKWQSIQNMQFLQNAIMMNQAMDDMDMISGISLGGGRIPVTALARAMQKAPVFNNISVTNSQVGIINTGDLAKIDAAITMTKDSDADAIGQRLKVLVQAIVDANEVNANSKKEMIELIQALSDEIVRSRKRPVIMALIKSIEDRAKGLNAILKLVGGLVAAITQLFG